MADESTFAAMREALLAALQPHIKMGKAFICDCSLCRQIRDALEAGAGERFADSIREECALVADWKADQLTAEANASSEKSDAVRTQAKVAREVADRIRVLKGRKY
jgi:hypothetical protein